jgi:death-on-curing protein
LPSPAWRYLSVETVAAIHDKVLEADGGLPGLRDAALLESAVAAPQASFGGEPLLKDGIEIAAAYLFYLCRNHPFMDGNKRTALAAGLVFLESNGLLAEEAVSTRDVDAWEALVLDVAASRLDRDGTTARLGRLVGSARTLQEPALANYVPRSRRTSRAKKRHL